MLGDSIAVAAGIALGARMRHKKLVAMAWIGDGAMSTGAFHEGMNFAAVRKAPLVVVGEDNKYAYSTPTRCQTAAKTIDERASGYGIPHELVDGNDMLAVYDAAKRMVNRARAGEGAGFLGVDTMRMQGHAQHDDMRYVPRAVVEEWARKDPIVRFRRHLIESGTAAEKELDEVDAMSRSHAAEEARLAEDAPMPDPATLTRGVHAGDDFAVPKLEIVRSPFAERGASA
jgi:TPP-dependent pyruvate/acetoin dehydrogenase alpha subunit